MEADKVLKAFEIIGSGNQDNDLIKQADEYLYACEKNENFILTLLEIF